MCEWGITANPQQCVGSTIDDVFSRQVPASQTYLESWIVVQRCDSNGIARVDEVDSRESTKSLGKVRENPYEAPDGARPVHVFM